MKIAVLMSTYNGHRYLEKQLESLSNQSVAKDMILYIRDDGSTDDTVDLINKWEDKLNIKLIKGENVGPAKSFWKMLMDSAIEADYYAFCDQDDVWDSDKLESGINELKDGVCFYACNCRIVDEYGKVISERLNSQKPIINLKRLFVAGCTQGCSMMFTKELCNFLRKCTISCVPMHDIVLMIYAVLYGKIYWEQNPKFSYRVHSNNVVAKSNKNIFQRIKTTLWNWKNSSKNSMSIVANEILKNDLHISDNDREYLENVASYKEKCGNALSILADHEIQDMDNKILRSFKLRVLLKLY